MPTRPEVLQGTLEVMILSVLHRRALHGYAIAREIERLTAGALAIEEGSLYPALHRLTKRAYLIAEWRTTHTGRRARFYRLSPAGLRRRSEQIDLWHRVAAAVNRVLDGAPTHADPALSLPD